MNKAKKSILLVQWSFIPQGSGEGFLKALIGAVRRGVQVRTALVCQVVGAEGGDQDLGRAGLGSWKGFWESLIGAVKQSVQVRRGTSSKHVRGGQGAR